MVLLVTLTAFVVGILAVLAVYSMITAESPIAERIRRLVPQPAAGAPRLDEPAGALPRLAATVGAYGFGGGERTLAARLSAAGLRSANAAAVFLGVRTLISFGPALLIVVTQVSAGKPLTGALVRAGVVLIVGHLLANLWLRRRVQQRTQQLDEALPDSLDLMVICLEAGLGLNATIARVGQERAKLDDPLGVELSQVAFELRSGRSREEALHALAERNGVDDLKALAGLIVQSDKLGASLAKTLRVHADLVRTRRRQRAEEAARKLPIKVLLPLATMLLPVLFVIAIGPAFLRIAEILPKIIGQR